MKRAGKNFLIQIFVVIALIGLLVFPSCQDDDLCEELANNPLRIGFYTDTIPTSVDSITVNVLGMPGAIIYNNSPGVARMEFPLDPTTDSCGFVLQFPLATDTIWFTYERQPSMVSVQCGFVMHYNILTATSTNNFIMNIHTSNSEVINTPDEHIEIFIPAAVIIPGP